MTKAKQLAQTLLTKADIQIGGTRDWDIQVHNDQLFNRVLHEGSLGLGEAYVEGWWDCKALDQLFARVLTARLDREITGNVKTLLRVISAKYLNLQNIKRSKKVAKIHYNLDNDLYQRMLGPTMAYTCGYFKDTDDLDQAQFNKYDLVCKKLQLKPGEEVLELGCGWGGFAKHAATHYGVHMTSVNIAKEQVDYAKTLCEGLPVTVCLSDYREVKNYNPNRKQFDKVVSIGMCEHIGYKNYKTFMKVAHQQLKPHGLFLLHTIGSNQSVTHCDAWIDKYIFPGGVLPSEAQLSAAHERYFIMEDWHNFGAYYDTTLMSWYRNFNNSWPDIQNRYDERFYRLWSYYLLSCAGMFRARDAQLWQIVFSKDGIPGVYPCVR